MAGHEGVGARYHGGMAKSRYPGSIEELEARLAGAPGPTPDDLSMTLAGEVLDSLDAVQHFLAEVERARAEQSA